MNRRGNVRITLLAGAVAATVFSYQACSRTSFQSQPPATPPVSASTPASGGKGGLVNVAGGTTTDNPKPTVAVVIEGSSTPGVQNAQLCIKDVGFAHPGSPGPSFNVEQELEAAFASLSFFTQTLSLLQTLPLLPSGTLVDTMVIPPGNYAQVQLSLDPSCPSGSLAFDNQVAGHLQVQDPLILKFSGNLDLQPGTDKMALNIQPILIQLAQARSVEDVKRIVQGTAGSF